MHDTTPDTMTGVSVMLDPDSWEVTLRIANTMIVFKDLGTFEELVNHLTSQASRISKVEQRFRPISSDDAGRAVDAWESALLGTAEGNQEALEFLIENIGALREILGPGGNGHFSATALVTIQCFLAGKGIEQNDLEVATVTTFLELAEITRGRPNAIASKEFREWLEHG